MNTKSAHYFLSKTNWPEQSVLIGQLSVINVFKLSIEQPAFVAMYMVLMNCSENYSNRMCAAIVTGNAQNREHTICKHTIGIRIQSNAQFISSIVKRNHSHVCVDESVVNSVLENLFNLKMNICEF